MAKNRHIRPVHVQAICNIIHGWDQPKLSWMSVCEAAQSVLGYLPSRSGLSAHELVTKSFQAKKNGLKEEAPVSRLPNSRQQASAIIAARDAEIATLKMLLGELEARFIRWQYNVSLRNVTLEQLDAPLPEIDRIKVQGVSPGSRK